MMTLHRFLFFIVCKLPCILWKYRGCLFHGLEFRVFIFINWQSTEVRDPKELLAKDNDNCHLAGVGSEEMNFEDMMYLFKKFYF